MGSRLREQGAEEQRIKNRELASKHTLNLQTTLEDVERQLEQLKRQAAAGCRPLSAERKDHLVQLMEFLPKNRRAEAMAIVGQPLPVESVSVDIELLDPFTVRKLEHFV